MINKYLFGFLSLTLWCFSAAQIEVETNSGRVRGITQTNNGKVSYEFRGIPYAKPPVGNLRFKKPEPVANWTETRDATEFGKSCWQMSVPVRYGHGIGNMSEDCLSLNIYIPGNLTVSRAVMVWIHGGGYIFGAGREYIGQDLSQFGDVIVVTINYRLGVFGFGSTGDATLPGNLGLWDQIMALKWLNANIGRFGGDTSRITIFGESAGSSSVNVLSIAPHSKGLYQRVIGESGTILAPWALVSKENALWGLTQTAKALNCSTESNTKMVDCLAGKDAEQLKDASVPYTILPYTVITFAPVVDGELLTKEPKHIFQDKSSKAYQLFASLDYLSGFNSLEGITYIWQDPAVVEFGIDLNNGVPRNVALNSTARFAGFLTPKDADVNAVVDAMTSVYCKDGETDEVKLGLNIMHMYGDVQYVAPTIEVANSREASTGKTYVYNFGYFRPNNTLRVAPTSVVPVPAWAHGASHADELVFVFGLDQYKDVAFTADEARLSSAMMTFWTNFAKTGNPGNGWTEYDSVNKRYMDLDTTQSMKANLAPERMELHLKTLPAIYASKPSSTTRATMQPASNAADLQNFTFIIFLSLLYLHI